MTERKTPPHPQQREQPRVKEEPKVEVEAPKEEELKEGAPETETPEEPKVEVHHRHRAPRHEEAPEETPEKPAPPPISREEFVKLLADEPGEVTVEFVTPVPEDDEIAELYRHVSHAPVNSHAPVWTPRTSESAGG